MQKWAKPFILIGMFITAYLLILAWQKDYGHLAADAVATPVAQTAQPASVDIPSTSAVTTATPAANSDVPPVVSTTPGVPAVVAPTTASSPGLITVQNDIYRLQIDPKGGDVVRAELLNHLHADSKQPFVLLEQGAGRVYTAQSG